MWVTKHLGVEESSGVLFKKTGHFRQQNLAPSVVSGKNLACDSDDGQLSQNDRTCAANQGMVYYRYLQGFLGWEANPGVLLLVCSSKDTVVSLCKIYSPMHENGSREESVLDVGLAYVYGPRNSF